MKRMKSKQVTGGATDGVYNKSMNVMNQALI